MSHNASISRQIVFFLAAFVTTSTLIVTTAGPIEPVPAAENLV